MSLLGEQSVAVVSSKVAYNSYWLNANERLKEEGEAKILREKFTGHFLVNDFIET